MTHFDMNPEARKRWDLLRAMTPQLQSEGWQPIDTVPKDGTEVEIRLVHINAAYSEDPVGEGYIATAHAHWIDHNAGGLTWHGLCGSPSQWRLIAAEALSA